MKELVFATHNANKIKEIQNQLIDSYKLIGLTDIGLHEDIPETADTFEGNALLKARYVWEKCGISCFADDSGLAVEALGGEPGVYSARYAGLQKNDNDNIALLLKNLENISNLNAQFHTVITLMLNGEVHHFEGIIKGKIIREKRGNHGFGYDPIFIPNGYDQTFAEMPLSEKNKISHRARAVMKLIDFLNHA
ncbi:MAG: non-canonical purine NTP diphosphatase [Cytophagales bacterium]|nr:MAG: non-canonical purine NTP diphosphatase [Cytophagales bacterium]